MTATAMAAAATVKTTATAATDSTATMETAAAKPAANRAATIAATDPGASITITGTSISTAIAIAAAITVAAAIAINAAIAVAITATEPRTGSDKEAAIKPRRAVVSVRGAGVRIVAVVAVRTDRCGIAIAAIHRTADPNADRNLRMRVSRRREQQDTEYREIP
jgi:hypothetical protein